MYVLQFGVVGYHLYVLHYISKSHNTSADRRLVVAHVTRRANQLAAQGCNVTFGAKNVREIAERSRDAHDVNLAMMDAYLNDGVDFFLLLFPHVRAASDGDLQQLPSRSFSCLISVCLSVYLSVRSHISKTTRSNFRKSSAYVDWPRLGPPLTTMFCTSGFVDDVMFSHYGVNGPESKMTLFRRFRQMAVPGRSLMSTIALSDLYCSINNGSDSLQGCLERLQTTTTILLLFK